MMRIQKLELIRFGMFTEEVIDFGSRPDGNRPDIHLIYGDNEAGKTTLMDGYLRLLYGFPNQEPYGFFHQRKNLCVGAKIEINGEYQRVARWPYRPPNLTDGSDQRLPESFFQNVLSGLGEAEYRKLYCLNDDTIEKGGDEIISGKGEVGLLLFGAAAGISSVTELLDKVRKDADGLYKARASRAKLPSLKRKNDEINREIKSQDTTAKEYKLLRQEFLAAQRVENEIGVKRQKLRNEKDDFQALVVTLPQLKEVQKLADDLADCTDYPTEIGIDKKALDKMGEERARQAERQENLSRTRKEIEAKLRSVKLDQNSLGLAEELRKIDVSRSKYIAAENDIPKRRDEIEDILKRMRRLAKQLGISDGLNPEKLVLNVPELSQRYKEVKELKAQALREEGEIQDLDQQIEKATRQLSELTKNAPQGKEISKILSRHEVTELMTAYKLAIQQTQDAEEQVQEAMNRLSLRDLEFKKVPPTNLTFVEAKSVADELSERQQEARRESDKLDVIKSELSSIENQISRCKEESGVMSDAESAALKTKRDDRWKKHKISLTSETADKFERAMQRWDDASARRIESAASLGTMRQLEIRSQELENQRVLIEEKIGKLAVEIKEERQRLEDVSAACDINPPLLPDGLVAWLEKVKVARAAAHRKAAMDRKHKETLTKTDAIRHRIIAAMPHIDDAKSMDFAEIAALALREDEARRRYQSELAIIQSKLQQFRNDKRRREDSLKKNSAQQSRADKEFNAALKRQFKCSIDVSLFDEFLDRLREFQKFHDKEQEMKHRIERMEEDQTRFETSVKELAERFGVEVNSEVPTELFGHLKTRSEAALEASKEHKEQLEILKKTKRDIEEVEALQNQQQEDIKDLAAHFPDSLKIESLNELKEAVEKTENVIFKRQEERDLRAQIRETLGVADFNEAKTRLAGLDHEDIKNSLATTKSELERVEQEYTDAIAERSRLQTEYANVTDDDVIAALVEKRRTVELQMQETALEYLELHFGHQLAEEAIRRYSEKHRSSMLKATETAFSALTGGAYLKLQTQHESGKEILVALDGANSSKRTEDLSKGTRFQLYLALRAAAYEQMASSGTILPFFCDDVFETFDNTRTRAACTLMARIGRTGQAIYLTHHRHVVEIAKDVCGEDNVRVHEL